MYFSKTSAVVAGFASMASGHMIMAEPKPYASPQVTQGPITGYQFPCQWGAAGAPVAGTINNYALGSSQKLSFIGQAVHGGGSCQVSLTYDDPPTPNSIFRVIHSIEGGCPAMGQTGNMGDSATAPDPYIYNFTIPSNIPSGKATLAWTWFNKVGNREMYMNCAPVDLTGSAGSKDNFEKLPEIFKANIDNGCGTYENFDVEFPNPGDSVVRLNGATDAFKGPSGSCPTAAAGGSGSGSGAGASPPATTSPPAAKPTSVPGGVFATAPASGGDSGAGSGAGSVTPATSTAAASAAPSPTATAAAAGGSGSGSGSGSGAGAGTGSGSGTTTTASGGQAPGSACSDEGAWLCLGTAYQRCGSGIWSVVMPLAAGTTCTGGQGSPFNLVASGSKRAVRFRGRRAVTFQA